MKDCTIDKRAYKSLYPTKSKVSWGSYPGARYLWNS